MVNDKLAKVRAEIERLYNQSLEDENRQADRGLECAASVSYGKSKACKELLSFIDSMQKEPVSEDLVSIAEEYAKTHSVLLGFDCNSEPIETGVDIKKAIIYGANWQKQQMMKGSIDGEIRFGTVKVQKEDIKEAVKSLCEGDKVKLIVIKK